MADRFQVRGQAKRTMPWFCELISTHSVTSEAKVIGCQADV